jgi:hypothetical protein
VRGRRGRQTGLVAALSLCGCYAGRGAGPGSGDPDDDPGAATGDDGDGSGGDDASDDGGTGDPAVDCAGVGAGLAPLRRLTKVQYENTIADLFGGAVTPSAAFPESQILHDYTNNPAANVVSLPHAEDLLIAAEEVAEQVIDDVAAFVPCDPAEGDACAEAFIDDLAPRAFRRPLRPEEREHLLAIHQQVASVDGFADGIGTVVAVMLQSAPFLYLVEEGAEEIEPGVVQLSDHEIASRLSYLLWDTMPDAELLAAADAGELHEPEQIQAHVDRMLAVPERTGPALERFVREWTHYDGLESFDKDATAFPQFDDTLVAAFDEELSRFVQGVLWSDTPTFTQLLTSTSTEVDPTMAAFFGVDGPADGWAPVSLDPERQVGLLSRPAIIARHSSASRTTPTFRGHLVRTQLLCMEIPPAPPDAMSQVPVYPEGATERERTEILIDHLACGACHELMNPVGLGFEHFDAIGAWRDLDVNGLPVDARGEVIGGPDDVVGEFDGLPELAAKLAGDDEVSACFARHFYRHSLGLSTEQALACASEPVEAQFVAAGGDIHEMVGNLATSPAFRMRVLEEE